MSFHRESESSQGRAEFEQLITAARSGDRKHLGILLESNRQLLREVAETQIHDGLRGKLDPSDLVQEVFLAAQENIQSFAGSSRIEFVAWLRGILANVVATHVRRYLGTQKRDLRLEQDLCLTDADVTKFSKIVSIASSPSQQVIRNEDLRRISDAIESLPEDYREVIVLRQIRNLSFSEIAQRMGRSVNAVEKLAARALEKLRSDLGDG